MLPAHSVVIHGSIILRELPLFLVGQLVEIERLFLLLLFLALQIPKSIPNALLSPLRYGRFLMANRRRLRMNTVDLLMAITAHADQIRFLRVEPIIRIPDMMRL